MDDHKVLSIRWFSEPSPSRSSLQSHGLAQVEVDEMLGLMGHVGAEVASTNAVPRGVVLPEGFHGAFIKFNVQKTTRGVHPKYGHLMLPQILAIHRKQTTKPLVASTSYIFTTSYNRNVIRSLLLCLNGIPQLHMLWPKILSNSFLMNAAMSFSILYLGRPPEDKNPNKFPEINQEPQSILHLAIARNHE